MALQRAIISTELCSIFSVSDVQEYVCVCACVFSPGLSSCICNYVQKRSALFVCGVFFSLANAEMHGSLTGESTDVHLLILRGWRCLAVFLIA